MSLSVVDVSETHFVVRTAYDADLITRIKTLPTRRFDPDVRGWLVPRADRLLLEALLKDRDFVWTEDALASETHRVERCARIDGPRIQIRFPYDAAAVAAVREIDGRRWDADNRCWTAPLTSVRAVRAFAAAHGINDEDLVSVPDADPVVQPLVTLSGGYFRIRFIYDRDLLQLIRDLPTATFDVGAKSWRVSLVAAAEIADFDKNTGARTDEDAEVALANVDADVARLTASRATDADIVLPPLGGTLMPFQRAGVAYALSAVAKRPDGRRSGGVLIADEQGLGKTVQAIALHAHFKPRKAVIVCPSSLRINWLREFQRWQPDGPTPTILQGTSPHAASVREINIIGWEVLSDWQPTLSEAGADFVVYDEMHYGKTMSASRTMAAVRLADDAQKAGAVVIGLTGTPMLNRPLEILPLIRILGRVADFGGGVHLRHLAQQDPQMLNRILRTKCFIRRRNSEVLTELPPKRWASVVLNLSDEGSDEYHRAESDFLNYLATETRRALTEAGETDDEVVKQAVVDATLRALSATAIVAINRLRLLATRAKMRDVQRWISEFRESGAKVVIFAWHREIVEMLAEATNGLIIYGGMTDAEKQQAVDAFQTDPEAQVLVCGIKAAGVGLTLTAASDVVFVEQGWNPADMEQAADRCHRIGQTDSVTAWNLLAAGTIDEVIYRLIDDKRAIISAATDGDAAADADPHNVVLGLLRHLASVG